MASQRQILANRRNAQRSTGPRSEEGKNRASRNATRHGIFSAAALLPGEDEQVFHEFREGLYRRLRPHDELERMLADRVVVCAWKLRRVLDAEAAVFEQLSDARHEAAGEVLADHIDRHNFVILSRYETTLERAMYKAMTELRKVQTERAELGLVNEEELRNEPNSPPSESEEQELGAGMSTQTLSVPDCGTDSQALPLEKGAAEEPLRRRVHGRDTHAMEEALRNEANGDRRRSAAAAAGGAQRL